MQFEELVALDANLLRQLRFEPLLSCQSLLAFLLLTPSSPVYGVIFLFKYPTGEKPSATPRDGNFDFEGGANIFFAAQTIQNACGTQALLSVLLNKENEVNIGPQLKDFKDFTGAFPSEVSLLLWFLTQLSGKSAEIIPSSEEKRYRIRS